MLAWGSSLPRKGSASSLASRAPRDTLPRHVPSVCRVFSASLRRAIIIEEPAETLTPANRADMAPRRCTDQLVAQALVVALAVMVRDESRIETARAVEGQVAGGAALTARRPAFFDGRRPASQ